MIFAVALSKRLPLNSMLHHHFPALPIQGILQIPHVQTHHFLGHKCQMCQWFVLGRTKNVELG